MTAADNHQQSRKQQILEAAVQLFSDQGYYKTTTAHVAKQVGVTQPYVYHFFESKEKLFIAVIEQTIAKIHQAFAAVEAPNHELAMKMGLAFEDLLQSNRNELLLSMQSFTISEPLIRQSVKDGFSGIYDTVREKFQKVGSENP
ncbi:MAG: TetR family transcriptional regulator, partial [Paenibacillus sp. RIFOXYA1_FULL_44_5]